MRSPYTKVVSLLSSRLFFWLTWVLLIVQASWIAISARYPMAFDEGYHLGIIKLFAKQWSPLLLKQPEGLAPYGSLTRDPSVLHHWLLSFPYRLFQQLGWSEFASVVSLRLINVGFFAVGLILFRRLLQKTKASNAAINTALLFFVLIPTVPLVAGQINYDNLQFPLVALALLLAVKVREGVKARKVLVGTMLAAVSVSLLGSLNKFTFLPILTGIVIYLGIVLARFYQADPSRFRKLALRDWRNIRSWYRQGLLVTLAGLCGLFVWFYGVNIVRYRNPVVQCHQVLGPERCSTYGPWARNYQLAQERINVDKNPLRFTLGWLGGMHYRLFFTINGATGPKLYTNHTAPVVTGAAALVALGGLVLCVKYGRRILKKDPNLSLVLFVMLIYLVSLWGRNYHDFLQLGAMVAINGRYFHPILLPILVVMIAAYQRQLRRSPELKLGLLGVSTLLFLSGGGITGFIHYSDADWYWLNHDFVLHLNEFGKKLVAPFFLWR